MRSPFYAVSWIVPAVLAGVASLRLNAEPPSQRGALSREVPPPHEVPPAPFLPEPPPALPAPRPGEPPRVDPPHSRPPEMPLPGPALRPEPHVPDRPSKPAISF